MEPPKPTSNGISVKIRNAIGRRLSNTPKHVSWLNIAEIELSVLTRQALSHPIQT